MMITFIEALQPDAFVNYNENFSMKLLIHKKTHTCFWMGNALPGLIRSHTQVSDQEPVWLYCFYLEGTIKKKFFYRPTG